tara:strand:- start:71 stop:454 length:384 start_codon:yes stop_codon:yes gene_type:complete
MKNLISSLTLLLCTILFLWSIPVKAEGLTKFPYPIVDGHITLVLPCGPATKVLPYLDSSLGEKVAFHKTHEDIDIRFVYLENKETKSWTLVALSTVKDSSCIISHSSVKSAIKVSYPTSSKILKSLK